MNILHLRTTGSSEPSKDILETGAIAIATDNDKPSLFIKKNDETIARFIDEEAVKKIVSTSIIPVEGIGDITDPQMDKLYQISKDVLKSSLYLYSEGRLVKDVMRFGEDDDDGGLYLYSHDVTDWNDITPRPVMELNDGERQQVINLYYYEGEYYYFVPVISQNFSNPGPDDITLSEPLLLEPDKATFLGSQADTLAYINFCRENNETIRLNYIVPASMAMEAFPLFSISAEVEGEIIDATFSVDITNREVLNTNPMLDGFVEFDGSELMGDNIAISIRTQAIPPEIPVEYVFNSPFETTYLEMGGVVTFKGIIEDESEIVGGSLVTPGSLYYADTDNDYQPILRRVGVDAKTPSHTQVCTYRGYDVDFDNGEKHLLETRPVYFYNFGHAELTYGDRTYNLNAYGYGFDFLDNTDRPLSRNVNVNESALTFITSDEGYEITPDPIISINGTDYLLAKFEDQRAFLSTEGEMLEDFNLVMVTDTYSLWEVNSSERYSVPLSFDGVFELDMTEYMGQTYVSYYDENDEYHEKYIDRIVRFGQRPDGDGYWFYEAIPQMWDSEDNPVVNEDHPLNYSEFGCNFVGVSPDGQYAMFSWISYYDVISRYFPEIISGNMIKAYVPNAIVNIRDTVIDGVGESELMYISKDVSILEMDYYNFTDNSGNNFYPFIDFVMGSNVEIWGIDQDIAYLWAMRVSMTQNEMYMHSLNDYAKLMTTDDLAAAAQDFITTENVDKYIKVNNFVYLRDDESLPDSDYVDGNKIYVKDGTYYHYNKRGYGWSSFNSIIRVPDSYSSPLEYVQQNGSDMTKLYLASVEYCPDYYTFNTYCKYGSLILKNDCIGANGDYYRPAFVHFTPYNRWDDRPDMKVEDISPVDWSLEEGYHFYVCRTSDKNHWFDYYNVDDLNANLGLYCASWKELYAFQRVNVNDYLNNSSDFPRFLGFVPSDEDTIQMILEDYEEGFVIAVPSYFISTRWCMYRYDNSSSKLIEIGAAKTENNSSVVVVKDSDLPSPYEAKRDALYIYRLRSSYLSYGGTIDTRLLYGTNYHEGWTGIRENDNSYTPRISVNVHFIDDLYIDKQKQVVAHPGYWNAFDCGDYMGLENYRREYNYDDGSYYQNGSLELTYYNEGDCFTMNQTSIVFNPETIYAHNNRQVIVIPMEWLKEMRANGTLPYSSNGWAEIGTITNTATTASYRLYIALSNDTTYLNDEEYNMIDVKWVNNANSADEIFTTAELNELALMSYQGYVISCAFIATYEQPLVSVNSNAGAYFGGLSVNTSKILDTTEIYYHFTKGEHQFPMGESLLTDTMVQSGSRLFNINGWDFYYHFVPEPAYQSNPMGANTWYHVIAATANVSDIYFENEFNGALVFGYREVTLSDYSGEKDMYQRYMGNIAKGFSTKEYAYHLVSYERLGAEETGIDWDTPLTAHMYSNAVVQGVITIKPIINTPSEVNKYKEPISQDRATSRVSLYPVIGSNSDSAICYIMDGEWRIVDVKSMQEKIRVDNTLKMEGNLLSVNTDNLLLKQDAGSFTVHAHAIQISTMAAIIRFTIQTNKATQYRVTVDADCEEICKFVQGKTVWVSKGGSEAAYYVISAYNKNMQLANISNPADTMSITLAYPNIGNLIDNILI